LDHDPLGSYEPETEPWIGTKNQQKPKSEGKAPHLGIFLTQHHVLIQHLYRLYYYIYFYVIIKQGAQGMQRKRRTVLKLFGKKI